MVVAVCSTLTGILFSVVVAICSTLTGILFSVVIASCSTLTLILFPLPSPNLFSTKHLYIPLAVTS